MLLSIITKCKIMKGSKPSLFKNLVGKIALKEHTEKKGVHYHTLLFWWTTSSTRCSSRWYDW